MIGAAIGVVFVGGANLDPYEQKSWQTVKLFFKNWQNEKLKLQASQKKQKLPKKARKVSIDRNLTG
jgi:hypothetical protein